MGLRTQRRPFTLVARERLMGVRIGSLSKRTFAMSTSDIVIAHEPQQEQASLSLYAWVIVAIATVCLALGFGANIVISVFMKPLEDEFGWLRADTSMAYT